MGLLDILFGADPATFDQRFAPMMREVIDERVAPLTPDVVPLPRPRPKEAQQRIPLLPTGPDPNGRFSPQGFTGGPVNLPGRLSSGAPAALRSEGTEYERATRELMRHAPDSLLGALLQPQQSSVRDAIRAQLMRRRAETGFGPFGSLAP